MQFTIDLKEGMHQSEVHNPNGKFSPIVEEFLHVGYLCGCLSNVEHRCKEAVTVCPQNEGKPNQD